jgi:uncharacterized protein (TIGR02246 family)
MLEVTSFDKASLERFDHEFDNVAFCAGDYQAMASLYTDDARLMNEDSEPIEGREAIAAFWKAACERAKSVGMKRAKQTDEFECSGDLAFKRTRLTLEIPVNGQTVVHSIKSITIWKREADGVWRVYIDISNGNAPLDVSQFTYGVETK